MTLVSAFTTATANQRIVSPLFCGSHPYLHGSLTYRYLIFSLHLNGDNVKVIAYFEFFYIKTSFSSIIELEKEEFL